MFVLTPNLLQTILNFIISGVYIGISLFIIDEINQLKIIQTNLHNSIQQLTFMTDVKNKQTDLLTETNTSYEDDVISENKVPSEIEVNSEVSSDKTETSILPIQNHIVFPHFTIFQRSNYKRTKNKNKHYKELKHDTRLMSNQLSKFLNKAEGTCITFMEVYTQLWEILDNTTDSDTDSDSCSLDNHPTNVLALRKLFGITENEDYKITRDNLHKFLEPHLKKLNPAE